MDKFQNKYRIPSARLQSWDYSWAGVYFITICTQNREQYFGNIESGIMELSNIGIIADILWHEITNHTKNVESSAFVIMPNHIHGILILTEDGSIDDGNCDGIKNDSVKTGHALSLPHALSLRNLPQSPEQSKTIGQQRFQNIGKNSLSSVIGSYKSAVTKHAHRLGFDFGWQSRFHDHIIQNDDEFQRIVDYIITNPENWETDQLFKSDKF